MKTIWHIFVALFLAVSTPIGTLSATLPIHDESEQPTLTTLHNQHSLAVGRCETGSPLRLPIHKDPVQAKLVFATDEDQAPTAPTSFFVSVLEEENEIVEGVLQASFGCRSPPRSSEISR
ncbi:hypothetical protein [Pelagicoccus sp. SDUM812005]|uniref:hypothetical protein n=1 Tax=Pelagicoccus sp. SDUM812005 TaxID=3041257 RepID=UPI002810463C|nr:hypothetical protein [Pelagicoccus sp. SDUM812005]MDQ8183596.1 hypothetical protein [Pelagicoccus sp. SDUM812005]